MTTLIIPNCSIKVFFHLLVPGVYIEQFGITKVVIQLLVPAVYSEQLGITKAVIHLLVPEVN
jgi:hypothetical protein